MVRRWKICTFPSRHGRKNAAEFCLSTACFFKCFVYFQAQQTLCSPCFPWPPSDLRWDVISRPIFGSFPLEGESVVFSSCLKCHFTGGDPDWLPCSGVFQLSFNWAGGPRGLDAPANSSSGLKRWQNAQTIIIIVYYTVYIIFVIYKLFLYFISLRFTNYLTI